MSWLCEVRVLGEIGPALLSAVDWKRRSVGGGTVVRVELTAAELEALLDACADRGVDPRAVVAVGGAVATVPSLREQDHHTGRLEQGGSLSRDRAPDPGGPHRSDA